MFEGAHGLTRVDTQMLNHMSKAGRHSQMRKAIGSFIASRLNHDEISRESALFRNLDRNKDGYITFKELRKSLKGRMSDDQIQGLIDNIDTDNNGVISYTEFISATVTSYLVDESRLEKAFKAFDRDGNGQITMDELKQLFINEGEDVEADEAVKKIIEEIDANGDGMIDFEEFKKCMGMD